MSNTSMLVYCLIAMGIYFVYRSLPFLKKAKNISKGLFSKIYIDSTSEITDEEYKKLAIGALYSEQQTAYINSLNTGLENSRIKQMLSEWWAINTPEEARESLDYLQNKGFSYHFNTVYNAYIAKSDEKEGIVLNGFDQNGKDYEVDIEKAFSQLQNLEETWEELTNNNILKDTEELKRLNNVGWDCGRLVFLSRLCYDAEYISEHETWNYINASYDLAIKNFDDWDEFSKSYIIGRSMWGGIDCGNEGIMSIAEYLLKDEKSPWVNLEFKN